MCGAYIGVVYRYAGILVLLLLLLSGVSYGGSQIEISGGWVRSPVAGRDITAGYMELHNKGGVADRLIDASSIVARKVELHEVIEDGGVMRMRRLKDGILIASGGKVELKSGSYHLMLIDIERKYFVNDKVSEIPMTLIFAKGGSKEIKMEIRER